MENILNPGFYFLFRNGVSFKTVSREINHVTPDMTASWNETSLPTLLSKYSLENNYNADEFGLFFQCLPNKSFHLKSEECSGGKHSNIRMVISLIAANAGGEKLTILLLVKQRILGVLKTPRLYHVDIGRRKKAGWAFEKWVREINAEFKAKLP